MSITELIFSLIFLPILTIVFVKYFWNSRWITRKTKGVIYIWGIAQIFWFVGILLILPIIYWREKLQAVPDARILIPFTVSVLAFLMFCRGSIVNLTKFIKNEESK